MTTGNFFSGTRSFLCGRPHWGAWRKNGKKVFYRQSQDSLYPPAFPISCGNVLQ